MKDELKKFLEEKKEIIWIKTRNGQIIKESLKEYLSLLEEKRAYYYSEKQVINLLTEKQERIGSDLYEVLDNLYPLGIKKIPIYLLIEDSYNELLENRNINYLKEIYDTRKDSSRFNFTVIIIDKESLIEELKSITVTIEEKEKEKVTSEDWIEEYIINYADDNNLKIKPENFEEIFELLKRSIKKVSLKNTTKEDPFLKNMVFVKGGKYKPSFADEEKEVFDIEVCKYQVTQKEWKELMNTNPSNFIGEDRPVESISWWNALEYCNKLSEKYGLEPVYDLSKSKQGILKINQINEGNVDPEIADFKKTEGFRLPTEVEWEWFAGGGQKAIDEGTFYFTYSGSNNISEVAWYYENSGNNKTNGVSSFFKIIPNTYPYNGSSGSSKDSKGSTQDVGLKKSNQLGLYDCSGNVWEWCYDTNEHIEDGKSYIYKAFDSSNIYRRVKGGSWHYEAKNCAVFSRNFYQATNANSNFGFRVVRTI